MLTDVIRAGRADLYSIFRTRAQDCARALAIEDGSRKLTYAELLERVDRLAAVFLARGVAPGDRIAILSHNRSEYLEVELAAAGIGAIVACLNWRLGRHAHASTAAPPARPRLPWRGIRRPELSARV